MFVSIDSRQTKAILGRVKNSRDYRAIIQTVQVFTTGDFMEIVKTDPAILSDGCGDLIGYCDNCTQVIDKLTKSLYAELPPAVIAINGDTVVISSFVFVPVDISEHKIVDTDSYREQWSDFDAENVNEIMSKLSRM